MTIRCTPHALERKNQRNISLEESLTIDQVRKMPVYNRDNGCIKYLDIKNKIVYYVRDDKVVTMIKTNPIQMLKYYAFGKKDDYNKYCRDHVFNNCKYGCNCKYIHIEY